MKRAGIGGVHIIPIYGEKGDEKKAQMDKCLVKMA
jgi:methylaspartate ammonia-lyase